MNWGIRRVSAGLQVQNVQLDDSKICLERREWRMLLK